MYNKSMARKCESIYVLKSLEVQFLEGLLALAEEWGGHINMKQVTDASPFVYELASLNVDQGTFHGVEVPCDPAKLSFHTHPRYVQDVRTKSGVRYTNPLPSNNDLHFVVKCSTQGMPSLVITSIGTFVMEVTDAFWDVFKQERGDERGEASHDFFRTLFGNLQVANMEEEDTALAITRYIDNMRVVGVRVTHFPPGEGVTIRIERKLSKSGKCKGRALGDRSNLLPPDSVGVSQRGSEPTGPTPEVPRVPPQPTPEAQVTEAQPMSAKSPLPWWWKRSNSPQPSQPNVPWWRRPPA